MLEDKRLKIFAAVVKHSSFTAAAKFLGLSQPAVSQSVAELERVLGTKLFERGRDSVTLTEKGRLFESYARQILHWYAAAEQAFNPDPLRVGVKNPAPSEITMQNGRRLLVWTSGQDIHLEFPDENDEPLGT